MSNFESSSSKKGPGGKSQKINDSQLKLNTLLRLWINFLPSRFQQVLWVREVPKKHHPRTIINPRKVSNRITLLILTDRQIQSKLDGNNNNIFAQGANWHNCPSLQTLGDDEKEEDFRSKKGNLMPANYSISESLPLSVHLHWKPLMSVIYAGPRSQVPTVLRQIGLGFDPFHN